MWYENLFTDYIVSVVKINDQIITEYQINVNGNNSNYNETGDSVKYQ